MFAYRWLILLALLAFAGPLLHAQPPGEPFDYRRLLNPPKTTPEFWEAMLFELEVGKFDLAASHLRSLIDKKPTPDELAKLHEKEGISAFLRLRLVPRWFEDRAKEKQAREDVEALIEQVTAAVRAKLTDPVRIKKFVENLYGLPEEVAFARIELTRSGAGAIPLMIEELGRKQEGDRLPILDAMAAMGHDAMRPVLAALDINDNVLRENLLDMLKRRRDLFLLRAKGVEVAPALWPLVALNPSAAVRRKAREVLAVVYDLRSPDQLPLPLNALTEEAERYYQHRVRFADPRKVALWRWDGRKLIEDSSFTASKAEEVLGLRFARLALQLNPTHRPAQIVMLSLLIDKGFQAPSADRPLGVLRPTVEELLLTLDSELLNATLEEALRDERLTVILATIRTLGKLGDARALQPQTQGEPALVRALHHGDRRVQMAAVEAVLRIPGAASAQASTRILKILASVIGPEALTAERPRLLIASSRERYLTDLARAADGAGYEVLLATSGKALLRRVLDRADVDAVLIDATLPDPGLASLLGQLRTDASVRRLPVFVAAVPEGPQVRPLLEGLADTRVALKALDDELQPRLEERARQAERVSVEALRKDIQDPLLNDLRKRKALLEERVLKLSDQFEVLSTQREEALRKHLEKQKHVWVVSANAMREARLMAAALEERIREVGMPPLSKVERKENLETAVGWLARMALGDLAGFDVRPVEDAVIATMQAPGLSDATVLDALRVLGRIPSIKAQRQLITTMLDRTRKEPIRVAAADELRRHMHEYGMPEPAQLRALLGSLETELKQPGLEPQLRDRMTRFIGGLRPGDRTTGQRLRDFPP